MQPCVRSIRQKFKLQQVSPFIRVSLSLCLVVLPSFTPFSLHLLSPSFPHFSPVSAMCVIRPVLIPAFQQPAGMSIQCSIVEVQTEDFNEKYIKWCNARCAFVFIADFKRKSLIRMINSNGYIKNSIVEKTLGLLGLYILLLRRRHDLNVVKWSCSITVLSFRRFSKVWSWIFGSFDHYMIKIKWGWGVFVSLV